MRDFHHFVRVEVESGHRIVALWLGRFLLDAEAVSVGVKLGHTVTLRIADLIAEHGRLPFLLGGTHCLSQLSAETCALEYVVSKHETGAVFADEVLTYDECLRESVRGRLLRIFKIHSEITPVTQKS